MHKASHELSKHKGGAYPSIKPYTNPFKSYNIHTNLKNWVGI
jgi:hypothetical protein